MTNMISWIKGVPETEMYNHVSYQIMFQRSRYNAGTFWILKTRNIELDVSYS